MGGVRDKKAAFPFKIGVIVHEDDYDSYDEEVEEDVEDEIDEDELERDN